MTRLTNNMREAIIENAIAKSTLPERFAALDKRAEKWREDVRIAALGGPAEAKKIEAANRRILKQLEKFPSDVVMEPFRTGHNLMANFAGERQWLEYADEQVVTAEPTFTADHPVTIERGEISNARDALNVERSEIEQLVAATVHSVTTIKKLLEVWPECVELIPSADAPMANLPAVPVPELNALIGLPSQGGAA